MTPEACARISATKRARNRERDAAIVAEIGKGRWLRYIARQFGVSLSNVSRIAIAAGVARRQVGRPARVYA